MAGIPTKVFKDYKFGTVTDFETGEESETGLPKSNVLYFEFDCECGAWLAIRPSGTEPKIRVMVECNEEELMHEVANEVAAVVEKELA